MACSLARHVGLNKANTAEQIRLQKSIDREADWKNWGPYVSDRAWGTVREDYSPSGDAWSYFSHDQARSRAYRWNEDGIAGFCNRYQNVCLALAFWNGKDPIIKERFFGLTGSEGNHGEDVKEYYFYLDNLPTHSYCKMLYKYPAGEFPYAQLVHENKKRGPHSPEFELLDTGIFDSDDYFDIYIEYAKADQSDLICNITAHNRSAVNTHTLHILPHVWFRNVWGWGYDRGDKWVPPTLKERTPSCIEVNDPHMGTYFYSVREHPDLCTFKNPHELLFTENNTNSQRLFRSPNATPYVKDGINDYVVHGAPTVNPAKTGTKAAGRFFRAIPPGGSYCVQVRFADTQHAEPFADVDAILATRKAEADDYYSKALSPGLSAEDVIVQRQAFAGLLWSKQFYHYGVDLWLEGDPSSPVRRGNSRNKHWKHLYANDVISMPDKWEYPWFAAWDLAFHTIPIAMVDHEWAQRQLTLMLREWYMHPSGQLAAYEWNFEDVNPPVHGWATLRVYNLIYELTGSREIEFLEKTFHKLLLNFTWWVNRKDAQGNNIFEGGFLGLDNIGVFDRSNDLPEGGKLQQADATAWMAMYCLNMLAMSIELAKNKPAYEDIATKFLEHFVYISHSISHIGENHKGLWDNDEGFFYDVLKLPNGHDVPMKVRSFVGLIPLFAVELLSVEDINQLPRFKGRLQWFVKHRRRLVERLLVPPQNGHHLLSIVEESKMRAILKHMLDESKFLSDFGLRSLSKEHLKPYELHLGGQVHTVGYEPAESSIPLYGGNSNWRGPVWLPVNYLMIESLRKYHKFYGPSFQVEMPTGSGVMMNLGEVADALSLRLCDIFKHDSEGNLPVFGGSEKFQTDPHWKDNLLFYEYFHGDNGAGIGASHQTGWTALVASLLQETGSCPLKRRHTHTSDEHDHHHTH